jgi:hypothetical protein
MTQANFRHLRERLKEITRTQATVSYPKSFQNYAESVEGISLGGTVGQLQSEVALKSSISDSSHVFRGLADGSHCQRTKEPGFANMMILQLSSAKFNAC